MDIPTSHPPLQRQRFGFQFVILGFFLLMTLARIYADWLWFDSLGYLSVFKTVLFSKIAVGAAVAAVFFALLALNIFIVSKNTKLQSPKVYYSIASVVSVVVGFISSSFWFNVPRFLNDVPFGFVDPIFKKDIAFYMMSLPFYQFVLTLFMIATVASLVMVFVSYLLSTKTKKTIKQTVV